MDKTELIKFLKENLRIELESEDGYITATLKICDEEINTWSERLRVDHH